MGYDYGNAEGASLCFRSNTFGTENNDSHKDGCLELFARSGSNVSVATLFNDGSFYSRRIAFSINSVGSNYIRFDNGLQIAFGRTTVSNANYLTIISYPVPFKDSPYISLVPDYSGTSSAHPTIWCGVCTPTSFNIYASSSGLFDASGLLFNQWIAIGWWK